MFSRSLRPGWSAIAVFIAACGGVSIAPVREGGGTASVSLGPPGLSDAELDGYTPTEPPLDVVGPPAEYEPVERVLVGWHGGNWEYLDFFGSALRAIQEDVVLEIAVEDAEEEVLLRDALGNEGVDQARMDIVVRDLDSMWIRDYGPVFARTVDGGLRVIDLRYHVDRQSDDRFPVEFAEREGLPLSRPGFEMEGGHFQSDGQGRCVVTDDLLWLNEGRLTEEELVGQLRGYLGCRETTVVPALDGEETGHLDVFAYVTGPRRIVVGRYSLAQDRENARRLNVGARALREAGWEVTRIHMPGNKNRHVFRTHTNVVVTDRTVLVPVYRSARRWERQALSVFGEAFPDRRVVPIEADSMIELAGALHCSLVTVPSARVDTRADTAAP